MSSKCKHEFRTSRHCCLLGMCKKYTASHQRLFTRQARKQFEWSVLVPMVDLPCRLRLRMKLQLKRDSGPRPQKSLARRKHRHGDRRSRSASPRWWKKHRRRMTSLTRTI